MPPTSVPPVRHHCMHLCHNKRCANPYHLAWGTAKQNKGMSDEWKKVKEVGPGVFPVKDLVGNHFNVWTFWRQRGDDYEEEEEEE